MFFIIYSITALLNPRFLNVINILNLTSNKQIEKLYTLVIRKKKYKHSIIHDYPIIIYLHVLHHIKENMTAYLIRQRIIIFSHRETLHAPPQWPEYYRFIREEKESQKKI